MVRIWFLVRTIAHDAHASIVVANVRMYTYTYKKFLNKKAWL